MLINDNHIGKILRISDVPQKLDCENCNVCVRLRLMELGLFEGEFIQIESHSHGLWRLQILNSKRISISSVALRDEEMERVFVEDECSIELI